MNHMSDYDRKNVALIITNPESATWTNAHIIRFIDTLIKKGAREDIRSLWTIYPEQIVAVMMYDGWSLVEIEHYLAITRSEVARRTPRLGVG